MLIIFFTLTLVLLFISQWLKLYADEIKDDTEDEDMTQLSKSQQSIIYWYELTNMLFGIMLVLTLIFYFIEPYIISSDKLLIEDSKVLTI